MLWRWKSDARRVSLGNVALLGRVAAVAATLLLVALDAPAQQRKQPIDTTQAQIEMAHRVQTVRQFASNIGLPESWIGYCFEELYLHTYQHPMNGHIPFGVNYNDITDPKRLELVIASRENYERSFQILCLANVKKALADAKR
jgi:hypothetical protein